jgi:hypothetical protein
MIFGEQVRAAEATDAGGWIDSARFGEWGTLGALVPNHYDTYLRVEAAPADIEDWWTAQRQVEASIASVAARHTSTPDRPWFAVWEGHGFGGGARSLYRDGEPGAEQLAEIEAHQAALREEDARRRGAVRSALSSVPRFALPHRTYYLLSGSVLAATFIKEPGNPTRWRPADLWWPDDRSWFVATDVDFWCLYVAGSSQLTSDVAAAVATATRYVTLTHVLEAEA